MNEILSEPLPEEHPAVELLRSAVDACLALDTDRLDRDELLAVLRGVEQQCRRLPVLDQRLVAAVESRRVAYECGATSTAALLTQLLLVAPGAALARVRAAAEFGPRITVSGSVLGPQFEHAAAALAAGSISIEHATLITATIGKLPDQVQAEAGEQIEAMLVEQAATLDPAQLAHACRRLRDTIDPDGTLADDDYQHRRRDLRLRAARDGSGRIEGYLTAANLLVWSTILDALAAPAPAGDDGEKDHRTVGQRTHDALQDAGLRLLRAPGLPDTGGTPTTILVTLDADQLTTDVADLADLDDLDDLDGTDGTGDFDDAVADANGTERGATDTLTERITRRYAGIGRDDRPSRRQRRRCRHGTRRGLATTAHGRLISVDQLLTLAAEAQIIPVVCSSSSGILAYGRTRRIASAGQRLALAARDKGCSFPGCTRPPSWTQVHHVRSWLDGGPTDLDNLTLLCGHHHRSFTGLGWACRIRNGHVQWIPPAWLDPERKPRTNTAHHTRELLDTRDLLAD